MSWTRAMGALGGTLAALAGLACGDSEPVAPEKARTSWSEPAEAQDAAGGSNSAPVIHSVSLRPREPAPGERVKAIVDAADPDGDRLELTFVWHIGGDLQPASGQELELGELMPGENVSVAVTASDGQHASAPREASVRVRNRRPVVTKVTLQPGASISRGEPVTALAEGSDPDGSPLTFHYTWLVNGRHEDNGPTLETDTLRVGDRVQVRVIANDGDDDSDPILTAAVQIANGRPEILSTPVGTLTDGAFHYRVEAQDPDGDRNLRFYLKQAPEGMTINAVRGDVRWRPGPDQAGKHPVEIVVEDPDGGRSSQTFDLTVASEPAQPAAAPAD